VKIEETMSITSENHSPMFMVSLLNLGKLLSQLFPLVSNRFTATILPGKAKTSDVAAAFWKTAAEDAAAVLKKRGGQYTVTCYGHGQLKYGKHLRLSPLLAGS